MFTRNYTIELLGRNLSVNLNLQPNVVSTWDAGLWRGPRILVPVVVEALVIEDDDNGPWADMRLAPEGIPGYLEAKEGDTPDELPHRPGPFEDRPEPRAPGVYLHWALPDALTRGEMSQSTSETPPTMEDVGAPPQPEPEPDEDLEFPLIPDRWLVIRTSPGSTSASKRRVAGWVIESEEEGDAAVTSWFDWEEDRSDSKPPRWLTVLGEGDPAYMAYYDNVENMLGFYDDLSGITSGPLTYTVMGWYSRREDDPLYGPKNQTEFMALLQSFGWAVGDDSSRIQQAADAAKEAAEKFEFGYAVTERSPYAIMESAELPRLYLTTSFVAQAATMSLSTNPVAASVQPELVNLARNVALKDTAVSNISRSILAKSNAFQKYWPRQMLCHGTVFDVRWQGGGGTYAGQSGPPPAGSVRVAIGNTGMEALAAAIADRTDRRSFERLLTAYHYGLLAVINDADGIASLESLLHTEDFASRPGGYVVETIEEGDLFPKKTPAEKYAYANFKDRFLMGETLAADQAQVRPLGVIQAQQRNQVLRLEDERTSEKATVKGVGQFSVNMRYVEAPLVMQQAGMTSLYNQLYKEGPAINDLLNPTIRPTRKLVPIRRALPRFWEPKDPAVLLIEPRRSYKHGEDGRFSPDGTLACRVTGETVTSVTLPAELDDATVKPTDLAVTQISSGQLPPEVGAIYGESLLLDASGGEIAAEAVAARNGVSMGGVAERVRVLKDGRRVSPEAAYAWEVTSYWNLYTQPEVDAQALLAAADVTGTLPSLIAVQPWRRPWTPLHLEWEVAYYPSPQQQRDWRLVEHDYAYDAELLGTEETEPAATYTGRTLLTPAVARTVAQQLEKFLEDEANDVTDVATDAQENSLADLLTALEQMDTLGTSLAGFHDALIGIIEEHSFESAEIDAPDETPDDDTDDETPLFPVRAGHLRLQRLRIVDAFGQVHEVAEDALNTPYRAADVEATGSGDSGLVRLPPRIVQPTRAMFRLLSAEDDSVEANKNILPICGWLLPDHLDEALEVYDADGISQGQVQLAPDLKTVEWQGVPGNPTPLGAPPNLQNAHLSSFIDGLLGWGVRDKAATDDPEQETPKESALSALLRMIDATLWTVDPIGREGDEHLSVLVGRPLAVVRADLYLELEDVPLTDELARTAFPFRLGAVTRLHDGLMGYFVNDDYSQLYPVHESIAAQTRPSGPNAGFLGPIQQVPNYYHEFGQSGEPGEDADYVDPVEHPYINTDPVLYLRPGQRIRLTLLVDPRGGVHVTSGMLPRKRIDLMREHVAKALDNIIVTFRVGPVLTDPEAVRMPLPAEIRGRWSWVSRSSPTVWQEVDVATATDDAILGDKPTVISEGWLKLSGAYIEDEEDASP